MNVWRVTRVALFIIVTGLLLAVLFLKSFKLTGPSNSPEQPIVLLRPTHTPVPQEAFSIDGAKKLIVRPLRQADGSTTYTVVVSDRDGGNAKTILTKTLPLGVSINLHNAWAPGDAYVFVEEKPASGTSRYLVMKSSGEPFAKGEEYLDVNALFAVRETGYTFRDATGWASETLLIVRTNKDDGSNGPSFWFEIPSGAFIQLAR